MSRQPSVCFYTQWLLHVMTSENVRIVHNLRVPCIFLLHSQQAQNMEYLKKKISSLLKVLPFARTIQYFRLWVIHVPWPSTLRFRQVSRTASRRSQRGSGGEERKKGSNAPLLLFRLISCHPLNNFLFLTQYVYRPSHLTVYFGSLKASLAICRSHNHYRHPAKPVWKKVAGEYSWYASGGNRDEFPVVPATALREYPRQLSKDTYGWLSRNRWPVPRIAKWFATYFPGYPQRVSRKNSQKDSGVSLAGIWAVNNKVSGSTGVHFRG